MAMIKFLICLSFLAQTGKTDLMYVSTDGNPVLSQCLIKLKSQNEIRIPAQEAGLIIEMPAKEGSEILEDGLLAKIDDREARATLTITEYALESATKKADEDIEIRYAKAAADVAEADLKRDLRANLGQPGRCTRYRSFAKKLDLKRARLQTEKAAKDQVLAGLEAKTKEAERDAAKMALEWRTILAPFEGEVVEVYRQRGEWVNPGDPILKLARFDEVHVEGVAYADKFDREELLGKPVTVTVTRARGRKVSLEGYVVHVDQSVRSDRSYIVRAEIQNKKEAGHWLIQPGLSGKMTIRLK